MFWAMKLRRKEGVVLGELWKRSFNYLITLISIKHHSFGLVDGPISK
jgi:hypothetical protein